MEATVTNRVENRVIVLANHALARRKRERRFWGTMGAVLRFEDRRALRTAGASSAGEVQPARKTAFETRVPR
jgi:hypothetical protein